MTNEPKFRSLALSILLLAFTVTASAQVPTFEKVEVCDRSVVRGCDPPTTLQVLGTRPPLDAPVKFYGTIARSDPQPIRVAESRDWRRADACRVRERQTMLGAR